MNKLLVLTLTLVFLGTAGCSLKFPGTEDDSIRVAEALFENVLAEDLVSPLSLKCIQRGYKVQVLADTTVKCFRPVQALGLEPDQYTEANAKKVLIFVASQDGENARVSAQVGPESGSSFSIVQNSLYELGGK